MEHYDVIVVGAGSAGVPLAARLSENRQRKVLLVDAGPHYKSLADFPEELQRSSILKQVSPSHPNNWAVQVTLSNQGVRQVVPRGKVVGGSSALNGCQFERGLPADFDDWARRGNDQWSFDKVLPFFKKIENDLDIKSEYHGNEGPIPVRRARQEEWLAIDRAFVNACLDAGYPEDHDMNAPTSYGAGALAVNSVNGLRMNTAVTYLPPEVLAQRENLAIRGDCFVTRIVFSNGRATGIEVEHGTQRSTIGASEVVLSAGAVKSPHILMLSGIGPASQLECRGIKVVFDAPGVGQDFSDHCSMGVQYAIPRRENFDFLSNHAWHVGLHYTAPSSPHHSDMMLLPTSVPMNDLILHNMSLVERLRLLGSLSRSMNLAQLLKLAWQGHQHRIGVLLMKGESRGRMTLASSDPHVMPQAHYNYLDSSFDMLRLRHGFRLASDLLRGSHFTAVGAQRTSPTDQDFSSDSSLDAFIRKNVQSAIHMAGTCRMGPDSDPGAVTDQYCKVRGVDGVRVVDMSVWPEVVRRCANASAVMTGERAAEFFG